VASKDIHPIFLIPADKPALSRLIAFVIGAATTLAFAPFGWSIVAPVLLIPLLYICLTVSPRDAAMHAFWYGFGLFLTGTYWIYISVHVFGNAALWIALLLMVGLALIMAAITSLGGWLIARLSQGEEWLMLFIAPAAWVIVEWLRGWVLTGFPWMAIGYGQIDTGYAGWAPVLGVYGVTFMVAIAVGLLTPPYGVLLFVNSKVAGIPSAQLIRSIGPFVGILIIDALIVAFVPDLVLAPVDLFFD